MCWIASDSSPRCDESRERPDGFASTSPIKVRESPILLKRPQEAPHPLVSHLLPDKDQVAAPVGDDPSLIVLHLSGRSARPVSSATRFQDTGGLCFLPPFDISHSFPTATAALSLGVDLSLSYLSN